MFGLPNIPYGMLGVAGGTDTRPTNTPEDMQSLLDKLKAVRAANATPNGQVARGFAQFGPQPTGNVPPMLPTPPTPGPVNMGPPANAPGALSANAQAPAGPTPQDIAQDDAQDAPPSWHGAHSVGGAPISMGPTSVGGAPLGQGPISVGGAPLPQSGGPPSYGPSPTQASGPDVINKLLSFFNQKGSDYEMPKSENSGG